MPKQRRGAWEILVPCSVLVLGAALWFVALQAFVLHRFCPWCMTAHTCGAVAAILLLTRVPVTDSRERRDKDPAVPRSSVMKFAIAAILAVALLGIAQTVAPRKAYSVSNVPLATSNSSILMPTPDVQANASPAVPSSKTNLLAWPSARTDSVGVLPPTNTLALIPPGVLTLDVFAGRIRLDLSQTPIWGSPNAPLKLVSLYDYTCHHCRDMHPRVTEVQRSFGDKLAVVSLPMPLDAQCNHLITRTARPQMDACLYARVGVIVWRANRNAIETFDDWLFGFEQPPPLIDVTNKAVQLVGTIPFEAASADPGIEEQLRTAIAIFEISMREYRNGRMPQFIIGTNLVTGILTTEQLRAVVEPYAQALPK